jgi:acyl-CoA thioester hydrolase
MTRIAGSVSLDGEIRDGRHHQPMRVYYEDTDFSGIVYHANYLRYMERGRSNYMRLRGVDQRALFEQAAAEVPGFVFVVRTMHLDFRSSARLDDLVEVVSELIEVRGASVVLRQSIMRDGEVLVEARVHLAFISGGRARPIPKAMRLAMKADQDASAGPA